MVRRISTGLLLVIHYFMKRDYFFVFFKHGFFVIKLTKYISPNQMYKIIEVVNSTQGTKLSAIFKLYPNRVSVHDSYRALICIFKFLNSIFQTREDDSSALGQRQKLFKVFWRVSTEYIAHGSFAIQSPPLGNWGSVAENRFIVKRDI